MKQEWTEELKQPLIFTSYSTTNVKHVQSASLNLIVSYIDFSSINLHCCLEYIPNMHDIFNDTIRSTYNAISHE
jgi:hypothetical protein